MMFSLLCIHFKKKTKIIAPGVLTLMLSTSCLALLSGSALAVEYTTTQTVSLQDGDSVTVSGNDASGRALEATSSATVNAPANNTLTSIGNKAFVVHTYNKGISNLTGTKINVNGANSVAVRADYLNATSHLNAVVITAVGENTYGIFSDRSGKVTAVGTTVINAQSDAVYAAGIIDLDGIDITSSQGRGVYFAMSKQDSSHGSGSVHGNSIIRTNGDSTSTVSTVGVWSSVPITAGNAPLVDDGVSVTTNGKGAYGVGAGAKNATLKVNGATVITNGDNADGARAQTNAKVTLNTTHITTHGANASGAAVGSSTTGDASNLITMTGATLATTGVGSHAVKIYGATNNIKMDATTVLHTEGAGSHAISIEGGATKTYQNGGAADDELAENITVNGAGSAVFHAVDAGSVLTISDYTLGGNYTLGDDTWTAIAEDGGKVDFENITGGIQGVWAKGADATKIGTVVLGGATSNTTATKARVDAFGLLDISTNGNATTFTLASLEGVGAEGAVNLGSNNLIISGDAKTSYAGILQGTGSFIRSGTIGSTTLSGDNSLYTGALSVTGGTLFVDGSIGSNANVAAGGNLGGSGTIAGDVTVVDNGTLVGQHGKVLSITGNLVLNSASNINVQLGAADGADGLFKVGGDLTLAGKLNVTDGGGFGPGDYHLFDYTGTLTNKTMVIGTAEGVDTASLTINVDQNAKQVSLNSTDGQVIRYWDGAVIADGGALAGGSGTWNLANTNWANRDGTLHDIWNAGEFAIFDGTAGTVTVDDAGGDIEAAGMTFQVDGYRIEGDALTLQGETSKIRVGNGDTTGSTMKATIASVLTGSARLEKTDYGTLILTGENTYTGGTTISTGTLQLGDGGTTGSVQGDILNNATLSVNHSGSYTLANTVSGTGALVHMSDGTLIVSAENTYSGGTTITSGTLQLGAGGTTGSIKGNVTNNGTIAINHSDKTVLDGAISGTGALQQNGTGTTVLTGNSTYSGGTTIASGTLQLGNGGTSGSIAGDVTNNGTLSFNRSDQLIFSKAISGTGSVTQDGTGTTLMTGANTYSGATRVNAGTLQQKMHGSFSAASSYTVAANATLDNGGYKTTLASLDNSGTVRFGTNTGAVVTITGNYTGNNGTIILNAVLNGDDSKTDVMKVGGDTSGTTTVVVNNQSGGLGAQTTEGIKIIDITGQSNGTFSLQSGYATKTGEKAVVAGAYAYTLHKNGVSTPTDGNWYLRSSITSVTLPACEDTNTCPPTTPPTPPRYNPGTPLYEGYANTMQALNKLPTLQQRVGNRSWSNAGNPVMEQGADTLGTPLVSSGDAGIIVDQRGVWGRIEGAHNRLEANRSTTGMKQDIDTFIMQAGIDGQFTETEAGRLIGGFTAQYGKANSNITSPHGDGKIDTSGWGLGGTLTWYGDNGVYLDTQAQAMWYDSSLNSATANKTLSDGNKGFGYGLSLEGGKRVDIDSYWSLTPQAQLTWSSVKFDTFNDAWGASVSNDNGDSLNARLGISADYRNAWRDGNGQITRTNIYANANLYQEFMGQNKVNVAGVNFDNANDKTWGGLGAGGTYTWADDKYALYGEGSLNTSLNNFANSYSLKGTVGLRVKW